MTLRVCGEGTSIGCYPSIRSLDMETEKELLDYFELIIPGYAAAVERVPRDPINYTYRIYRRQDGTYDGSEDPVYSQPTVIARYAPPYIAARGPSIKFSQYRQVIEAMALAMFDTRAPLDALSIDLPKELGLPLLLEQHASIRIPRPLRRVDRSNVLLMQDLDQHVPVEVWLKTKATISSANDTGSRLGSFISALQNACRSRLPQYSYFLDNSDTKQFLRQEFAATVQVALHKFGYEDAAVLGKIALEHYDTPVDRSLSAFTIGDSLSISVLTQGASVEQIGIVDWEFAGVGSMAKDVAHCTAFLRMLWIVDSDLEKVTTAFGQSLIESYTQGVEDSLRDGSIRQTFTRSFLILCGTKLIHSALWRRLCCCQEQCCDHVTKLVDLGVRYIRASSQERDTLDAKLLKEEEMLRPLLQL